MIEIELTKEEAEVISNYLFRKICRLEDAKLEDSYCYPKLYSVHYKLMKAIKALKEAE